MKKIFVLLLCLIGCQSSREIVSGKPLILVSVEPYVSMVEAIAGDAVIAKCVLPAYVDPHNWEPKQRDLTGYDSAKIWFTIGESFESPLLKKIKSVNSKIKAVSLFQNFEPISASCGHTHDHKQSHDHNHCSFDTHFWLDPVLDIKQAKVISDTLSKLMPEKAQVFEENFKSLKEKLTRMDETFQSSLKPFENKILLTSHGAYTYFCKRYNLRQLVIEPNEGKEPRPKDLTHLIATLNKEHADILGIYTQPQHSNKAAKILAEALALPMYSVDPYKKNYLETMVLLETYLTSPHANAHH
jgi:zinc transport system substrate-binding protein